MLQLSRTIGEKVVIGNGEIVITVTKVRGNVCKIGIEAAPDVRVERAERTSKEVEKPIVKKRRKRKKGSGSPS